MSYQFILEPYNGIKSRYVCPACGKKNELTLYINTETKEYLNDAVGKCNREVNCGYHYTPKQYFQDNQAVKLSPFFQGDKTNFPKENLFRGLLATHETLSLSKSLPPFSTIPFEIFQQSLKGYSQNHFTTFLQNKFGPEITSALISKYFIGTSNHWPGATVFWQIDANGKIRTGKIMLYDAISAKRIKQPYNHINWAHSVLKIQVFQLVQCFFGEHLIKQDLAKPVAIVESEKTAIIASVYLPEFIWLACGSLTNLTIDKFKILKNRKVILFPDLNCFDKWSARAKQFTTIANVIISDLLERKASQNEKQFGFDIADYLLKFPSIPLVKSTKQPIEQLIISNDGTFDFDETTITPVNPSAIESTISNSSFLGKTGKFYIPTPYSKNKYTVYPDLASFIKRICIPSIMDSDNANLDFLKFIDIDLKSF